MAIDTIIDFDCIPKQNLTTEGILERLKGLERARAIIKLFRENGDDRPPSQMGFELTRSTPEGEEETRLIVVQDLIDEAAELDPMAHHCQGCPANRSGQPFGCMSFIQYPISGDAERWLIDRLPVPDEPLLWLLLKTGVEEFHYDGSSIRALRGDQTYFEKPSGLTRRYGEFDFSTDQVFEMLLSVGPIIPNHAGILLLIFHIIPRNLEADAIMSISPAPPDALERYPIRIQPEADDDSSIAGLKEFFAALYTAWTLNVRLIVDA